MSEINQLIELLEAAKLRVNQWKEKAKAEAMEALFNEEPTIRADAMNRCWMRQGRSIEAEFWARQLQGAIDDLLGPKSTTVEKSTIVDKQAEATASAVVLGERQRRYGCQQCGTWYDQGCGHQLTDKTKG